MKNILSTLFLFVSVLGFSSNVSVEFPEILVEGISQEINIESESDSLLINLSGVEKWHFLEEGKITLEVEPISGEPLTLTIDGVEHTSANRSVPLWLSILPPLLAILMALIFKEVVFSLLGGLFTGVAIIGFYTFGSSGIVTGFFSIITKYIVPAVTDEGHVSVIIFSSLIGGIVAVVSKNGGMTGVVNKIAKRATTAKKGQMATFFLGIAIFFDDYANTLVVGNTMRPLTDKLNISREKLAYLVDSTAAPVAAIAFISTWIGAELGYIEDGLSAILKTGTDLELSPYSVFLSSLPFSFYPVLALVFMYILIKKGRDFGPMYAFEKKARNRLLEKDLQEGHGVKEDEFAAKGGVKPNFWFALLPILVVIIGTMAGLGITGYSDEVWNNTDFSLGKRVSAIVGASDSYQALLWASFLGLLVAVGMSVASKKLKLQESVESAIEGFKAMMPAFIILILAWSLAQVTEEMHTADFITNLLSDSVSPMLLPSITFILAALVAFSTGSSWGTMAIIYPLILPACYALCMQNGIELEETLNIFFNVVSCVLAGSVLGDHCSPISDTTILSSLATNCNHINHVRSQMPYALTVGGVALFGGILPASFGAPSWLLFPICIALLYFIVIRVGKKV
jgi:Na+/H+ antiporter NhaC